MYFIYSDVHRKNTVRNTLKGEGWLTLDCRITGVLIFIF